MFPPLPGWCNMIATKNKEKRGDILNNGRQGWYTISTICWLSEREVILNRQPDKMNYLYGRLSHEDELAGDSNSIINQRKILTKYAEENGFTPYEFIYDDGYSGADFERPAFARMIEEVEAGKVAAVIVKDMSRFGRDYLKVGFLTEILFPH